MPDYAITVERDGRFLLVSIPALNGVTQARFPGEVESMAGDYIALVTGVPVEDIGISVVGPLPTLSTADYEAALEELVGEVDELRERLRIYEGGTDRG